MSDTCLGGQPGYFEIAEIASCHLLKLAEAEKRCLLYKHAAEYNPADLCREAWPGLVEKGAQSHEFVGPRTSPSRSNYQ